jgi:hypothetical protein
MEALSYIVLILLSLVGYSGGTVGRAGKSTEIKPTLLDLLLVALIWGAAITSRSLLDLNKWLMILIWVVLSSLTAFIAASFRRKPQTSSPQASSTTTPPSSKPSPSSSSSLPQRLYHRWSAFSRRMGSFQSRILLSLFYFLIVTPFALAVKIFSDPLRLARHITPSHWQSKPASKTPQTLDDYRRQF